MPSIDTGMLAVLLIFGLPVVAVAGHYVLEALKILRGQRHLRSTALETEETRLIQDVHHGLQRLEGRVEALETLLMERPEGKPPPIPSGKGISEKPVEDPAS